MGVVEREGGSMTTNPTRVAALAEGLTEAQATLVTESGPGAWGCDDAGTGAELNGAGRWAAARALVSKGFGDIEEHQGMYPPGLYFNNPLGLAVRARLQQQCSR